MSEAAPYVERSRRTEPGVLRRADRTEQLQSYRYPSTGKVVDYFPPNITDEQHIEASPNQSTDSNFDLLPTPIKLEQTREGGPRSFFSPPSPSRRKLSPFRTPSTVSSFDESFIRSPDTTPPFIRKPLRLPPLLDISPVTPPPLSPVRRQLFRTPSPVRRQLFRTPSPVRRQPSPVLSPNRVPSPQPDILQNRHPIDPQDLSLSEWLNPSNFTESIHRSSRTPRPFYSPSPVLPPPIHQSTPVSSPPSHHSTPPQPVFTNTEKSMSEAAAPVERRGRTEPRVLRRAGRFEQLQSYRYPSTGKVVDYFQPSIAEEQHLEASPERQPSPVQRPQSGPFRTPTSVRRPPRLREPPYLKNTISSPGVPPSIYHSTPVSSPESIPPQPVFTSSAEESSYTDESFSLSSSGRILEDKSIQLDQSFLMQYDDCQENDWKLYAYTVLYNELLMMLARYTRKTYRDDKPRELTQLMREYLEEISNKNKELRETVSKLSEGGAKLALHNKEMTEYLLSSEQALNKKRSRVRDLKDEIISLNSKLNAALENIVSLERSAKNLGDQSLEEADLLEQVAASQSMANSLIREIEEERDLSGSFERDIRAVTRARLMAEEEGVFMGPELLQRELEAALAESLESSPNPEALSQAECHQVFQNMIQNLVNDLQAHKSEIQNLIRDIEEQKKQIKKKTNEKPDLNSKITELDVKLEQKRNLIMIYETEFGPEEKLLREYDEYLEDMEAHRIEGQPWPQHEPDSQYRFSPRHMSRTEAERGFQHRLPDAEDGYFSRELKGWSPGMVPPRPQVDNTATEYLADVSMGFSDSLPSFTDTPQFHT